MDLPTVGISQFVAQVLLIHKLALLTFSEKFAFRSSPLGVDRKIVSLVISDLACKLFCVYLNLGKVSGFMSHGGSTKVSLTLSQERC